MDKDLLARSDDEMLIKATLAGNNKAFEEIIRRYKGVVARTIKGMIGSVPEADDIGQETFIKLFLSLKNFRGEAKLSTYIQRIAVNLTLNEIKKMKRSIPLYEVSHDGHEREVIVPAVDYESARDNKEIVEKALSMIEPKFRIVLVMRMLQGYDTKETAAALNLPLGTVLSRLSRAQIKLEEIIKNKL